MGSENDASKGLRPSPRLNAMKPQPAPLPSQPKPEPVPLPSQLEEPENGQPKRIIPTEKDLESDEAVWALYEKWCIHHDRQRAHEDMQRRFDYFKESAKQALELNQKYNTFSNDLNRWSDNPDGMRNWMLGVKVN